MFILQRVPRALPIEVVSATAANLTNATGNGGGIVWFHGSAAQEDDWGYPDEYNVMRGSRLTVAGGLRPRPWADGRRMGRWQQKRGRKTARSDASLP